MTADRTPFKLIETDTNVHDIGAGICRVWIEGDAEPFARIKTHRDAGYLVSVQGGRDVHFDTIRAVIDQLESEAATMIVERKIAKPETIDIRPTWCGVLPMLLTVLECGTAEGKAIARAELQRMATAADQAATKESAR